MKIPVIIINGFLGSGKTTLLNNILQGQHGKRVAVLVNDFGEINIDADLVLKTEAETIALTNGCVCCTIQGDLIAAAKQVASQSPPPEYIAVETSGISRPLTVVETFYQADLKGMFHLGTLIAVVDADGFETLSYENTEFVIEQVTVADLVLLNKVDLTAERSLQSVKETLREAVPHARIIETIHAIMPIELLFDFPIREQRNFFDETEKDRWRVVSSSANHAERFTTWSWQNPQPFLLEKFRKVIPQLPPHLYRGKGVLYFADDPEYRFIFQMTGKRSELERSHLWQNKAQNRLVFIGEREKFDKTQLESTFKSCLSLHEIKPKFEKPPNY